MIPQQPQMHAVEARGSGFIINANGTIVTNNHVVKDAKSITVTLDDGNTYPAKVIGTDPRTDIAVLKIDVGHPLPYIQLGNSADVKPGQWVVAMGNPFGLGGTVTAGIVSAVSRDIGDGPYDQFIQTDAPINEGNSGGPLFTQEGKVIGMNTAILSPSGGSVGIGFAIPSDMIHGIVDQLEASGHVTRGYIGVEAQELTGATAKAMHVGNDSGALLAGIEPDSPASHAGLKPGDIITQVDGKKVSNPRELAVDVAAIKPSSDAHLTVLENGQSKDVALKVGQLPNQQTASNREPRRPSRATGAGARAAVARHAQPARCSRRDAGRRRARRRTRLSGRASRAATGRRDRWRRYACGGWPRTGGACDPTANEQFGSCGGAAGDPQWPGGVRRHSDEQRRLVHKFPLVLELPSPAHAGEGVSTVIASYSYNQS